MGIDNAFVLCYSFSRKAEWDALRKKGKSMTYNKYRELYS